MKCSFCGVKSKEYKSLDSLDKHFKECHKENCISSYYSKEEIKQHKKMMVIRDIIILASYVFYLAIFVAVLKYIFLG